MTAIYDFSVENGSEIQQGATFAKTLTWKDSAGTPMNLTGYTARMQIRPTITSNEITAELTTENGGIALGGVAGTIDLLLTAAQTAAITRSSGVYDLELVSGPVVTRFMAGKVTFTPEGTR